MATLETDRLIEASNNAGGDNTAQKRQDILDAYDKKDEISPDKVQEVLKSATLAAKAGLVELLIERLKNPQDHAYCLTTLYDLLREDSSFFEAIDQCIKNNKAKFTPLQNIAASPNADSYVLDRAAWVFSASIGHLPQLFTAQEASTFAATTMSGSGCSELGKLEALTNLMKAGDFRADVLKASGVKDFLFNITEQNVSSPTVYRRIFAMWLVSFDSNLSKCFSDTEPVVDPSKPARPSVVDKLKLVLTSSRVEKVIRLTLTVLTNFLSDKSLCESIVETGVLDVVQQLEYEKWRDSELYEQIRDVAGNISHEVNELSNFDRYTKELEKGTLRWGFIHSSKFWQENVKKFEADDFKAIKDLAAVLKKEPQLKLDSGKDDYQTTAVACHDMGEFVTLHPQGKKIVASLMVKERVMELMTKHESQYREVRREALLCCQKIMLNKWQDMKASDASK